MTMLSSRPARHVALWVALMAAPFWAWAQNRIVSVDSAQQAGAEVVRVEFAKPLTAVPKGFLTQTPPRIVIDLPETESGLSRNAIDMAIGNLTAVQVAQAADRTRLVLNLKQATTYTASLDGKALVLQLKPQASVPAGAQAKETVRFGESRQASTLPVKGIDFRRGSDGSGRIVVDLSSAQMGVDIRQQGKSLVLDLPKASLPGNLQKRWDVTDFGTPIQNFTASQSSDRVRIVVEPKGNWEHSAYQTDERFVLEIRPVRQDPGKLLPGPTYSGEPISFDFQNIDMRQLLHYFLAYQA
jgi:type IV pilus assembly protein PilQ